MYYRDSIPYVLYMVWEDIMYVPTRIWQEMVPTTLHVRLSLLMIPYRCFNYVYMFS